MILNPEDVKIPEGTPSIKYEKSNTSSAGFKVTKPQLKLTLCDGINTASMILDIDRFITKLQEIKKDLLEIK